MSNTTTVTSGGIGTFSLLGIVFVVLKLTHYIDWSWWWVTLPFWAGFAIFFGIVAIIGFITLLIFLCRAPWKNKKTSKQVTFQQRLLELQKKQASGILRG